MNDETKSIDMTEGEAAPETGDGVEEAPAVAQAEADPGADSGGDTSAAAPAAAGTAAAEGGKRSWRGRSNASKRTKAEAAPAPVADESGHDDSTTEQPAEEKTVKQKKQKKEKPVAEKSEKVTKERKPFFGDKVSVDQVRSFVGRAIWLVCVVFALSLALTALFVALSANTDNEAVVRIYEFANGVDFGIFDLSNPIKDFDSSQGPSQDVRTALFNYGIAAIVWLLIGRVADRIIQP